MALKVLLADDSAAIKKVIQLSLQDIGVELKTISSGKEALDLAKKFKPDIAFIDVLLPQKSGYEVAAEIRKDSALKGLPVVLLWSAFMAFDENKYVASGANAKLEKPFEAGTLRALISSLVPQATKQATLPKLEFEVPIGSVPPAKKEPQAQPKSPAAMAMPELPLMPIQDSEWVKKDLGKFTVPLPPEESIEEEPAAEFADTSFLFKPEDSGTATILKDQFLSKEEPTRRILPKEEATLSLEELSDLKLETREIIERVVWKLVPEMASQMIKEELDRLLGEEK